MGKLTAKVYNQSGSEVGTCNLSASLFGYEPNSAVVHQYVVNYLANQRQGTSSTKGRSEVSGGGKKPWRQKGTGRARAGTSRSPLWRGGGIIFGPKPRSFKHDFPKRLKRIALKSALSDKAREGRIKALEGISFSEVKTKAFAEMLKSLGLENKKALILDEGVNDNAKLSARNIPNVRYRSASLLNAYEALDADTIFFTKAGLKKAEEVFS
ncbi:MAG: 50S ribosomal protein L4 [candidate division Zixibacteria bacterium]|nr:50S ribosomal protein L4 [candidate division Zixibacteria bacterium]